MAKLGVIVLSYNRPKFLVEALESLENQTFTDLFVVVVDDGSNSETLEITEEFRDTFPAYHVIKNPPVDNQIRRETNRVAIGVNCGLRYLWSQKDCPEYISYLGDDDLYFAKRCEKMVQTLDKNPDVFLAYHYMEIYRCNSEGVLLNKIFDLSDPWTPANQFWIENLYNRIDHISFVHRAENFLWEEDPYFLRCADWGFLLGILALEKKFMHIPEHLAVGRKIEGDSLNMDGPEQVEKLKEDEDAAKDK